MRNKSIRFKLTLLFALILLITAALTFFIIRVSSNVVLRGTIRDYLITTVEENTDKIVFVENKPESETGANVYIPYEDGYLEIDADFLDVVNDVYAALYTQNGTMLYGENPLEKEVSGTEFTESYLWTKRIDGTEYMFYDRSLSAKLPNGENLWIRGVVPETRSEAQLDDISRISAMLLPIVLALIAVIVYFIIDKLLKPLSEIEKTAGHISRGDDLKERIVLDSYDDEVGRLAKAFNLMLDRLEKSFEAEKQFTQDASHELRTPTSVIMAQSEYILEKDRSEEEYKDALEVIKRQSLRMNDLIGDMLTYTRINQQSERYPMEELSLTDISKEIVDQMKLIGEKGIRLSSSIEDGIRIKGNSMLLGRLIQNLINNAYRYGKEDGFIDVNLQRMDGDGKKVILSVRDNGQGIKEEELDKIFDRFYRSDSSRSNQGTGLGLAMVKKIVEMHGGRIEVESTPGVGSTFKAILPCLE